MTVQEFLGRLEGVRQVSDYWTARCPAHEDRRSSLMVGEGRDGKVLLQCYAGCQLEEITGAVGVSVKDLFADTLPDMPVRHYANAQAASAALTRAMGYPDHRWVYEDAGGLTAGIVLRWDKASGKEIRPISPNCTGWVVGAMKEPRPLYRLPALLSRKFVVVVEGEKAADAGWKIGLPCTTSAGGSKAPWKTDWTPLAGKSVLILPDNDDPGYKYAGDIAGILWRLGCKVKCLTIPDLPPKGDLYDHIESLKGMATPDEIREQLLRMVD